jgi:hypothetical protein
MNIHSLHSFLGRLIEAKTPADLQQAAEAIKAADMDDDDTMLDAETKAVLRRAFAVRSEEVS